MNKIYGYVLGVSAIICVSCTTLDVEKGNITSLQKENKDIKEQNEQLEKVVTQLYRTEKTEYTLDIEPIVIPFKETIVIPKEQTEKKEQTSGQVVKESMSEALVTPERFIGGTQLFDYDENKQFPIITKCLTQTVIQLEPGEETQDTPFMSDSLRWEIAGKPWEKNGISTQLVIVKPKEVGLTTNMLIVTNKRIYNFILQSTKDMYMPMVRFEYPKDPEFITAHTKRVQQEEHYLYGDVDKDKVSCNYKIQFGWFFRPEWIPQIVYDDGQKTYIVLPEGVLMKETPVLFENSRDVVNYRVNENRMIVDKLINKITLRIGMKSVVILKKKGEPICTPN